MGSRHHQSNANPHKCSGCRCKIRNRCCSHHRHCKSARSCRCRITSPAGRKNHPGSPGCTALGHSPLGSCRSRCRLGSQRPLRMAQVAGIHKHRFRPALGRLGSCRRCHHKFVRGRISSAPGNRHPSSNRRTGQTTGSCHRGIAHRWNTRSVRSVRLHRIPRSIRNRCAPLQLRHPRLG